MAGPAASFIANDDVLHYYIANADASTEVRIPFKVRDEDQVKMERRTDK